MDWSAFTRPLDADNFHLFAIGTTEITVFTLVKLAISALLLWFLAGRFSRWTACWAARTCRRASGSRSPDWCTTRC